MNSTMEVHLRSLKLYGFHGIAKGEDVIAGEFEINLTAGYVLPNPVININQTVDYTALLSLVRSRMNKPTALLETLATDMASEIFAKFAAVTDIMISIYKLHPPIENFDGSVGITFTTKRN